MFAGRWTLVFLCLWIGLLDVAFGYCFKDPIKFERTVSGRVRKYCEYKHPPVVNRDAGYIIMFPDSSVFTGDCLACTCTMEGLTCCGFGHQEVNFILPSDCLQLQDGCHGLHVKTNNNSLDCFTGKPINFDTLSPHPDNVFSLPSLVKSGSTQVIKVNKTTTSRPAIPSTQSPETVPTNGPTRLTLPTTQPTPSSRDRNVLKESPLQDKQQSSQQSIQQRQEQIGHTRIHQHNRKQDSQKQTQQHNHKQSQSQGHHQSVSLPAHHRHQEQHNRQQQKGDHLHHNAQPTQKIQDPLATGKPRNEPHYDQETMVIPVLIESKAKPKPRPAPKQILGNIPVVQNPKKDNIIQTIKETLNNLISQKVPKVPAKRQETIRLQPKREQIKPLPLFDFNRRPDFRPMPVQNQFTQNTPRMLNWGFPAIPVTTPYPVQQSVASRLATGMPPFYPVPFIDPVRDTPEDSSSSSNPFNDFLFRMMMFGAFS